MDESVRLKLFWDVVDAAKYSLEHVTKSNYREEYYDRLLHSRLGRNYDAIVEKNMVNHEVVGKINKKPEIFKTPASWTSDLTPDIHLNVNDGHVFIETKIISRKWVKYSNKWNLIGYKYIYSDESINSITASDYPLPVESGDHNAELIYNINNKSENFFFNEGQLWADIIRMLCIKKAVSFYLVAYVLDFTYGETILIERVKCLINKLIKQDSLYSICCYSPESERYNKLENPPFTKKYIEVNGSEDKSKCVWIDKHTTDIKCSITNITNIKHNNNSNYAVVVELSKTT